MTELFRFEDATIDFTDYILIIPSVSVGNVPQLAVDLLISSVGLKKGATLWHPALVSSVGADPYEMDNPQVCTACELYYNTTLKLALLQLRSAISFKLATKFFTELKSTLLTLKFQEVIILASSYDYEMHKVTSQKFYFIANHDVNDLMKTAGIDAKEPEFNGKYVVHGSGFAIKLYQTLKDDLKCIILIKYVSEGDNRPDAVSVVQTLSKFVNCIKEISDIKFPISWKGVFGGPPPLGMY